MKALEQKIAKELNFKDLKVGQNVNFIYTKKPKYKDAFSDFDIIITNIDEKNIFFYSNIHKCNCSRVHNEDFLKNFKITTKN